jgi:methionyl-tRNA synthetase
LLIKMAKFYITTSIAYTNAPPHLGYALELVQADVLARYHQLLGEDVFFLTGTDEHGQKVARKAEEAKKTPEQFTDELSEKFKGLTKILNLSNSDFIRTTDKERHWPNVKKVWEVLSAKGDIYKKRYQGLYCVGCEAFVKEKDLVNGKCAIHDKAPEMVEEENYFFKLSKLEYVSQIKKEIEEDKINIVPSGRKNEILSFINQGVEDISISRSKESLQWGIPVPGDDGQIIYIWFEALINYLLPKDKGYWPPDVHCIGKDIFRFHALIWPIMLLALNIPRPKNILVHGFITSSGQKMSKSLGNVVDPFELVKKYGSTSSPQAGADAVRYFLLREIPTTEDGDYTEEKFIQRYNADLAGGIGNLTARVVTLAEKFRIQSPNSKNEIKDPKLREEINKVRENYKKSLEDFKLNEALILVWELISFCDKIINEEKPWQGGKEKVISDLLSVIDEIANLLKPFLPETSDKIFKQLKEGKSQPLFPRI